MLKSAENIENDRRVSGGGTRRVCALLLKCMDTIRLTIGLHPGRRVTYSSHWSNVRIAPVQNNLEITRQILELVRDKESLEATPIELPEFDQAVVMRHAQRLIDDGMADGNYSLMSGVSFPFVYISDLTTDGHNFLSALEQEDIWNRLTTSLSPKEIASLSFKELGGLAKEIVLKAARKKLGL